MFRQLRLHIVVNDFVVEHIRVVRVDNHPLQRRGVNLLVLNMSFLGGPSLRDFGSVGELHDNRDFPIDSTVSLNEHDRLVELLAVLLNRPNSNRLYGEISHFAVVNILIEVILPFFLGYLLYYLLKISGGRMLEFIFLKIGSHDLLHRFRSHLLLNADEYELSPHIYVFGILRMVVVSPGGLLKRRRVCHVAGLYPQIRLQAIHGLHNLVLGI
ncbi:hypothetical protein D3C78_983460 [compost metagenome]